jgi:hypothetical protein
MKGFETSYTGMFNQPADGMPNIERIEIPIFQRDYAQGRDDPLVQVIREDFLDVLVTAVSGGEPAGLDFVYGEVEDGTFRPLDGQQRLTTLFLLHWYVAVQAGTLTVDAAWTRFSYGTRATAVLFCKELVRLPPPPNAGVPRIWITDQPWFLHAWRHDPTIQSMLTMLDEIHAKFSERSVDFCEAWRRLTRTASPAISFLFLPIEDMGSAEDLYIKMNSRGRPLTRFENFKARFEKALDASERRDELVGKIDGEWADVLWHLDGGDYIIDDEFIRYLSFIIEICEWRTAVPRKGRLDERAERVFGGADAAAAANLEFLFQAFDTWYDTESKSVLDVDAVFEDHFVLARHYPSRVPEGKVKLFESSTTNLLDACCRSYGVMSGTTRTFTLAEGLLLYAVLLHRQHHTEDFAYRLRVLRNLTDTADDYVRVEYMPAIVAGVERIIVGGSLDDLPRFNPGRVEDERAKRELVGAHPELAPVIFALEDHPLLRGRLFAFELDEQTLASRANAFTRIADPSNWPELTGALLAQGDYSRRLGPRSQQFGSPKNERAWRDVLSRGPRADQVALREALGRLLDEVSDASDLAADLKQAQASFLNAREDRALFDWRYYFVRYPAMRSGESGIYFGEHLTHGGTFNYSACMPRGRDMRSYHRDPYLLAVWQQSGSSDAVRDPWFEGYEYQPRWLQLKRSGISIRCIDAGFEIQTPQDGLDQDRYAAVCRDHGVDDEGTLAVAQVEHHGERIDTMDRIRLGAALLRDLLDAGF